MKIIDEYVKNTQGLDIYIKKYLPLTEDTDTYTIIIIHGIAIHGQYYAETAKELCRSGFNVITLDLHGHGNSEGIKGNFISTELALNDIEVVVKHSKENPNCSKVFLLAESMGGAFTYAFLKRVNVNISGVIFIAPAFLIRIHQFFYLNNLKLIHGLIEGLDKPVINILSGDRLANSTSDSEFISKRIADPLSFKVVSINYLFSIAKASFSWFFKSIDKNLPIIIFHGNKDSVISPIGSKLFFWRFSGADKELHLFHDAYHTLLFDKRTPEILKLIIDWVRQR